MNDTNSEFFYAGGSDLASRVSARDLRGQVEQAVMQGKRAVIELSNVISMSESYADELFAVLVAHYGLEWFANNIQLRHQSPHAPHVLLSIATAIRRRLENQDSHEVKATIDGLIAAKKYANAHPVHPQ